MASDSYPRAGNNAGQVTELMYERLASPQAADGLIGSPSDPPLVFADSIGTRTVHVRANRRALLRGFQYDSGGLDVDIQLPTNTSGTTRVDLIVLRLNRATWRVQETFVQGTPGQGAPSPVQQVDSGLWDLPVAAVTVVNNAATLAANTVSSLAWYIGADGQYLCTAATSPPHERGRLKFETDTAREFVSTGTAWRLIADDASGLLVASGGISHSGPVLYRRNGTVMFALSFWRPNGPLEVGKEYSVGTVPAGFRPPTKFVSTGMCGSAQAVFAYAVGSDGAITASIGATAVPTNRTCVLAAMSWPSA